MDQKYHGIAPRTIAGVKFILSAGGTPPESKDLAGKASDARLAQVSREVARVFADPRRIRDDASDCGTIFRELCFTHVEARSFDSGGIPPALRINPGNHRVGN